MFQQRRLLLRMRNVLPRFLSCRAETFLLFALLSLLLFHPPTSEGSNPSTTSHILLPLFPTSSFDKGLIYFLYLIMKEAAAAAAASLVGYNIRTSDLHSSIERGVRVVQHCG